MSLRTSRQGAAIVVKKR